MARTARLLYTDAERDADLFYLTRFHVGDPVPCLVVEGKTILVLGDLEIDRARAHAGVDEVVSWSTVEKRLQEEGALPPRGARRTAEIIARVARDHGVEAFEVPGSFPLSIADALRALGLGLRTVTPPFVPERVCKTPDEVGKIRTAIRHTERAIRAGIDHIRRAEIRDGMLFDGDAPLTSEAVRRTIGHTLLENDCFCESTIVAGGIQGVDPHQRGTGPLPANSPILLDVFPRHLIPGSRYHGDLTRTVVRGKASDTVKRMRDTVMAAKLRAEELIAPGVSGADVHRAVQEVIEKAGFETGEKGGRMVGFFHGTGHGLGLDVHEAPGLGRGEVKLEAGNVLTVEPGLYYPEHGGMRIEDNVVVTDGGCENLCELDYELEV